MKKSDNKPYNLMAGACYGICVITRVTFVLQTEYAHITAQNVIFGILLIGMVAALFLKNEKAVIAAA